jgi:hypothetical protein
MDLPHRPMTPPTRDWYASKMAREGMQSTFADAVYDEQPLMLPLLFHVDEVTGIAGGRMYQRVCATSPCHEENRMCLHLSSDLALPYIPDW